MWGLFCTVSLQVHKGRHSKKHFTGIQTSRGDPKDFQDVRVCYRYMDIGKAKIKEEFSLFPSQGSYYTISENDCINNI